MSRSISPPDDSDELTEEDRKVFERLAEHYDDDDPVARISEIILQSSEENNS